MVLIFPLIYTNCMSVHFVQTGKTFDALPAGTEVRIYSAGPPPYQYSEIGRLTLGGGDPEERMARAKEEARERGGNALLMQSSQYVTGTQIKDNRPYGGKLTSTSYTSVSQVFIVLRVDYKKRVKVTAEVAGMDEMVKTLKKILRTQEQILEYLREIEKGRKKAPACETR